ncbi:FtsK/SpoIIIE domain-containing protein [Halobacillus sp. HZG1]|uniref:FtsK/SpoIIIE domain-containing protein n=1 Tax=Halobacillus sp. HZG1 TaxID=3111769 RepID=UPI002DBC3E24|nr:FtsK/SpoIIIE domain-containing protein [Halobacillus sp. HZG1]MEC3884848.1 FtsK/SpoIIIE domain-containing protein [Halobacillus sp. HZG1]
MKQHNNLLGKWIYSVLRNHFYDQKSENAKKLFIKINGLTKGNIEAALHELRENTSDLEEYYSPIIRTIRPVEGFDEYKLREIETSTRLRNYTFTDQALVMIINENTPEGQSLENIFSIDEAYLLSEEGFQVLYSLLFNHYNLAEEEIETLKSFMKMYNQLTDPQLRFVLRFISSIVNSDSPSIIERIQNSLPELNLFKDNDLLIPKGQKRLKSNYLLANLQKTNGDLDAEDLQNKLYEFLENEEKNGYPSELWNKTTQDTFEVEAMNFLSQKSLELLKYDFSLIESIFKFKVKIPFAEKIRNVLPLEEYTKEQKESVEEGISAIEKGEDADDMQEFYDEFEGDMAKDSALVKTISRKIEKVRHPKDYKDLSEALLYHSFVLIEEKCEEFTYEPMFTLEVVNKKLNPSTKKIAEILFKNINHVVPSVHFLNESLADVIEDATVNSSDVTLDLKLVSEGKHLGKESFKVLDLEALNLLSLFNSVHEGLLPFVKNYKDDQVEKLDINDLVKNDVESFLSVNEPGMEEHYNSFLNFKNSYSVILQKAYEEGIFSIDYDTFESELSALLEGVTTSVSITNTIYKYINNIGAIDYVDVNLGEVGYSYERMLTILNPVRLLSLKHRYQEIDRQIHEWIRKSKENTLEVTNLEEYLNHAVDQTLKLAPRYFTSEGDDSFLIEVSETLGEGHYVLNTTRSDKMDHLAKDLSKELLTSVKSYFDVYPYAKDGLDILFLYCQSAEMIIESVDTLFKKIKDLNKLKITVHSTHAAPIHRKLNQWVQRREEYIHPDGASKFPKVELKVISGHDVNEISKQINSHMIDADLVVLADYFAQSSQIKYDFDRIDYVSTDNWFEVVYKEPLLDNEVVKRISYVSEALPPVLKSFYQLQYISQKKEILQENEVHVLKNKVSLSTLNNDLIDFMHENFNWIIFMDRYLDKSLLEKTSGKAQIIQYKSKAGSNNNYKLIVSSSEYIRKLSNQQDDEYYDRLTKKLGLIMKNPNITKEKMVDAVQEVKKISGALVLKAIGPGKYSHEMVATYLSKKFRERVERNVLQVWSVCDELPWFSNNKRRPDMVITTLKEEDGELHLDFEVVELKFVRRSIFEKERYDAVKQVEAGKSIYEKLFGFNEDKTDSEFWREELGHYFIERGSYSPEEAHLLKQLQDRDMSDIKVTINTSIDVYCYTSNLQEEGHEKLADGVYFEKIEGDYPNYMFSRSFILDELGATEASQPDYTELEGSEKEFEKELAGWHTEEDDTKNDQSDDSNQPDVEKKDSPISPIPKTDQSKNTNSVPSDNSEDEDHPQVKGEDNLVDNEEVSSVYPEVVALEGIENHKRQDSEDHELLKNEYVSKLENNFNRNNLNVKVKEAVVGSSVIRLMLHIPSSLNSDKVLKRKQDIQLWLGLDQPPHMFIDKNGLNIDIARENPDTIFFEEFMKISREQLSDKVKKTNLVSPLGFDPLNNVINIDFSDPSTPHLLTGGTTGSGKSVTLNSIILGSMCIYEPSQLQFVFIDPKQVEFTVYNGLPHTRDVVTDINEAVHTLKYLVEEMESRYKLFADEFVSNLDEYVELTGKQMPRIVIVFDEFADFMSQDKEIAQQVENSILRLGQKARAAGLHLIICTQNPKSDIINTNIRNNLGARLALAATDATASTVILGDSGAENLGGKGDFLAKTSANKFTRGKSPFLTPQVKRALLKYFASLNK